LVNLGKEEMMKGRNSSRKSVNLAASAFDHHRLEEHFPKIDTSRENEVVKKECAAILILVMKDFCPEIPSLNSKLPHQKSKKRVA
jgi:hypothetical protein